MAGSGGGGGGSETIEAGAGGVAGEMQGSCSTDADCDNDDPTDGAELCELGVCKAGNAPPRVLSVSPADGADDAEPDATIEVVFSEPLDPDTVTADTVKVFAGETEVAGTLKLTAGGDELRFTPESPLALWASYRLEVGREISDWDGATMLDDVSSRFRVRDGVWTVTTLAEAAAVQLPSVLPIAPSGAVLPTWITSGDDQCGAAGAWVLRGQTKVNEIFGERTTGNACAFVSASIAADGSAVAIWRSDYKKWNSKRFFDDKWSVGASAKIDVLDYYGLRVVAHDKAHMSVIWDTLGRGSYRAVAVGETTGSWDQIAHETFGLYGAVDVAFDAGGLGVIAWASTNEVAVVNYDPKHGGWETQPSQVPGIATVSYERGPARIARSPEGDAIVVWVEGPSDNPALRFSRFEPDIGWQKPANISAGLVNASFVHAPALVFDGETFVAAWTGTTGGKLTSYTARYEMKSGKWSAREPHISELGDSALAMPRLGVDRQGNGMLVWAVGEDPIQLVYQRYEAETESWGEVHALEGASFSDSELATQESLPFAVGPDGQAGVMFRSEGETSQSVELAQFF